MSNLKEELILWVTKFSHLVNTGFPLCQSFSILDKEIIDDDLKTATRQVVSDIETGSSLADAMKKFHDDFDKTVIALVETGEIYGILDLTLEIIPKYLMFGLVKEKGWKK